MRVLFFCLALFSAVLSISAQSYSDVHVCFGFDNVSPITVAVRNTATGLTQTSTLQPATCNTYTGVGLANSGNSFTITTSNGALSSFSQTSASFLLSNNSCYNTYVLTFAPGTQGSSLTVSAPNGVITSTTPTVGSGNSHLVFANYASDSLISNTNGASLSRVNATVNGDPQFLGPVCDWATQSASCPQVSSKDFAISGSTNLLPESISGFYSNNSGIVKQVSVSVGSSGTGLTLTDQSCYYALIYGTVGVNFDGLGYRLISPNGITGGYGFGYVFSSTGSAPTNATTGGSSSSSSSSSSGPRSNGTSSSSSTGTQGGAAFSNAIASPLAFFAMAFIALFATQL